MSINSSSVQHSELPPSQLYEVSQGLKAETSGDIETLETKNKPN